MKTGRALDMDLWVAMGNKKNIRNPNNIPHYTSNLYEAYLVVHNLEKKGWSFSTFTENQEDGKLLYRCTFKHGDLYTEFTSPSLSEAIGQSGYQALTGNHQQYESPDEKLQRLIENGVSNRLDNWTLPGENSLTLYDVVPKDMHDQLPEALFKLFKDICLEQKIVCIPRDDLS